MSKELLLKEHFETATVELSVCDVTVRSLSRAEALRYANKGLDVAEAERKVLSKAMLDPVMSEEDIAAWQESSPAGEIQKVFAKVVALSGMEDDSLKSAQKSNEG